MEEQEVPSSDESFLKTYGSSIGFILFIIILCWNACSKVNYTEKNGIVTVAKVIEYEAHEQGSSTLIHIYLGNKIIPTHVTPDCYYCEGKYYFIKVLKDDPENTPLFYEDKPVPDCIIENVKYFEGWNDFPTCDSLK
jgi:hypothetical protein